MRETLEMPKQKEINEEILHTAIDELLVEANRDKEGKLSEGFFWRVILLYCQKTGEKMPGSEEIGWFYAKIRPIITKALDEKGRLYEEEKDKQKTVPSDNKAEPKPKSKFNLRLKKDPQAWVDKTYG